VSHVTRCQTNDIALIHCSEMFEDAKVCLTVSIVFEHVLRTIRMLNLVKLILEYIDFN